MKRIVSYGIDHWFEVYYNTNQSLLYSFDFTNTEQGYVEIKKIDTKRRETMGSYDA